MLPLQLPVKLFARPCVDAIYGDHGGALILHELQCARIMADVTPSGSAQKTGHGQHWNATVE